MSTAALIVEVADPERQQRQEYVFARSPIRIGRSQLNDLPLEHSFVSHCHGLFHFDAGQVEFVDVGSTNGSFLSGQRLEKNRRVALTAGSAVTIGGLRLTARLEQRDTADTRASYAFRVLRADASPEERARAFEPVADALSERRPLSRPSSPAPGGSYRPPAPVATPASAAAAFAGGESARQAQALLNERFARSFLELRRGQRQLLRDLGIQVAGTDKLQTFDNARDLLGYLLDPAAPAERIDELSRAYADLMMHEVALVSAISAGSRELLEELAPQSLAPRGFGVCGAGLRACSVAMRAGVRSRRRSTSCKKRPCCPPSYSGRSFARAYAAALGKSSEAPRASRPPPRPAPKKDS